MADSNDGWLEIQLKSPQPEGSDSQAVEISPVTTSQDLGTANNFKNAFLYFRIVAKSKSYLLWYVCSQKLQLLKVLFFISELSQILPASQVEDIYKLLNDAAFDDHEIYAGNFEFYYFWHSRYLEFRAYTIVNFNSIVTLNPEP